MQIGKRKKNLAVIVVSLFIVGIATASFSFPRQSIFDTEVDVHASSGHWQDIQDAVDTAVVQGGGDVHIPGGTWDFINVGEAWSGTGGQPRVEIPAGVNLYGALNTRDVTNQNTEWRTVLTLPVSVTGGWEYGGISWFRFTGSGLSSAPTRISDLKLVGYRSIDPHDEEIQTGFYLSNMGEFRIDHVYLDNLGSGIVSSGVYSHGVIDHSVLINTVGRVGTTLNECTVFYGVQVSRSSNGDWWDPNIQNVLGQYTDYTVFIEDCYFQGWRHCIASNNGAHYVFRYSTIKNDFGFGSLDAHGWGVEPDRVGTRAVEIYENSITDSMMGTYGTMIRGGAGIAFNNIVGGGTYVRFLFFGNEASWPKCWVQDWWVWSNTMLSGCTEITKSDPENNIIEGSAYFRYEPSWYNPFPHPHPLVSGEIYVPPEPTPTPSASPDPDATPTPPLDPNATPDPNATLDPNATPSPTPSPVVKPNPPEPTGVWVVDGWNSLMYWLRWELFGWIP